MAVSESLISQNCPTALELRAFDKGLVSDGQIASITAHLEAGCSSCDITLDEIAKEGDEFSHLFCLAVSTSDRPQSIRHYQIAAELGRGGMGVVYRAVDPAKRTVALKQLLALGAADKSARDRFRIETEAWARIKHPNVVRLLDSGIDERQIPYLVLEYVDGQSLDRYCQGRPLVPRQAAKIAWKIATGIQACHESGVIHRDIKPTNILMTMDGQPLVTDFGLARILEAQGPALTQDGTAMGTPQYMSPEQAFGEKSKVGERSDVYSIGATLYEFLAGTPPFSGSSSLEILDQVKNDDPVALRRHLPGIPRDLETICLKCLEKDPLRRYLTAGALATDLRRFLDGKPIAARPIGPISRGIRWCRRNPTAAVLIATMALASFGLASFAIAERIARHEATKAWNQASFVDYLYNCRMADFAWRESRLATTTAYLAKCPEGERNIEWHILNNLCHQEKTEIRDATIHGVVQWSPDGQKLISFPPNNRAIIWDAKTGESLVRFPELLADGPYGWTKNRLVSLQELGSKIVIYDLSNPDAFHDPPSVEIQTESNQIVALSPDEHWLVGLSKTAVTVWDFDRAFIEGQWTVDLNPRQGLAFHPTKPWLLTLGAEKVSPDETVSDLRSHVALWELPSGRLIRKFEGHTRWPRRADFSNDGRRLITGTYNDPRSAELEEIIIWDVETGNQLDQMTGHVAGISAVDFHPDGHSVLVAGLDSRIQIWRLDSEGKIERNKPKLFRCHGLPRWASFDPTGENFAVSGDENAVRIWNVAKGQGPTHFQGHPNGDVFSVAISPDGARFATGGSSNVVKLGDVSSGTELSRLMGLEPTPAYVAFSLSFSPDGMRLAAGARGIDHQGCIWDVNSGSVIAKLTIEKKESSTPAPANPINGDRHEEYTDINSVAFDPSGRWLATGGNGPVVRVWNGATGAFVSEFATEGPYVEQVVFSADGRLGVVTWGGRATIYEFPSGKPLKHFDSVASPCRIAFSPDMNGRWVGISDSLFNVQVLDSRSGEELSCLRGHEGMVTGISFHPNGQRVVTVSDDRTVRIWELPSGRELLNRDDHDGAIRAVQFSPDAQKLITAGWGNTTLIWDISSRNQD